MNSSPASASNTDQALKKSSHKNWLKWATLGLISIINGYAIILMYMQGEYIFALLTLVLASLGVFVFANRKTYAHRYIYPGVAGMILFVIFPLVYTIGLAFTNYSGANQLSFERAQSVFQQQTYQAGNSFGFDLYQQGDLSSIVIKQGDERFQTAPFALHQTQPTPLTTEKTDQLQGTKAPLKVVIKNRNALKEITVKGPNNHDLVMSGLRKFGQVMPLYLLQDDNETFVNQKNGEVLKPNWETGNYQAYENGEFVGKPLAPGFVVNIGWENFTRIFTDPGIQGPFFSIFVWTVVFSALTVVLTTIVGMVLGCIVQWEALKGKAIYRVLLILPYAVPAFISILIFKGLFNQSFGEINQLLEGIFGISPNWFTDPILAKTMIVVVNTWLGYPYIMILCMGLLKAIPEDLYEASAMDGATPFQNFFKITLPMLIKPLTPLLIASFAFNFNNFVLIQLLTNGQPDMIGTSTPAGHTDLLVSYTYRIAFEGGGGQDFGLAGAIAAIIFLLVGGLSLINLKFTKLDTE
ncbi:maltose ABC transporter permease MalF [Vibrio sp. SS-MA-C1-2]|uniref:maltose ABC transporter permease MalF n=1 Tax=Vibrio sp. SS-MA-C1-2 TaxID=2908646 RepID=UPI001F1616DD|nr:maltose ABC transporter permease MalF [Vibrio sp. SS-MA-C1-2]UJF17562.1 maltose ABC transporter permease MalF [Vibrio sp. SS-MA-C1-2]